MNRRRRELAERIAARLFVAGSGEKADRLMLMARKPSASGLRDRDLGGWNFEAAVKQVEQELIEFEIAAGCAL